MRGLDNNFFTVKRTKNFFQSEQSEAVAMRKTLASNSTFTKSFKPVDWISR